MANVIHSDLGLSTTEVLSTQVDEEALLQCGSVLAEFHSWMNSAVEASLLIFLPSRARARISIASLVGAVSHEEGWLSAIRTDMPVRCDGRGLIESGGLFHTFNLGERLSSRHQVMPLLD